MRNKRAEEDPEFAKMILQIGDGHYGQTTDTPKAHVTLPQKFLARPEDNVQDLIKWTYGDLRHHTENVTQSNLDFFANRCIVAPTNEAANEINEEILATYFDDCEEFLSCDSIQGGDASEDHYPVEFFELHRNRRTAATQTSPLQGSRAHGHQELRTVPRRLQWHARHGA